MTVLSHARRLRATTVTVGFRALHATFAVATRSPVAIEFLERLYGAAEIGDARPSLGTFSLLTTTSEPGRRWAVSDGDSRLAVVPSLGAALYRLEQEICMRTVASRTDHIAMHGATVLTEGGAAFITGPSGAGKSTLSLALAALGYQVGGDDVAFLDPRSGTIRPLPRCFHVDARSRRLLRGVGLALPERALRYNFMTPADFGVTDPPASPVRLFLFLGRRGARTTQLSALSHAEMMVRLLSETPSRAHSPGHVMATLSPLIGAAGCYQLLGGRLADTAGTVAKLLEQA